MTNRLPDSLKVRKAATAEIAQELCDLIAEGSSIDEARAKIEELHGVTVAKSTVHGWPEYKVAKAKKNRRRYAAQKEAAENGITNTINTLIGNMQEMQDEIARLVTARSEKKPGSFEYTSIHKNIKDLYIAYADHANKYQSYITTVRANTQVEGDSFEQNDESSSIFDDLEELPDQEFPELDSSETLNNSDIN